MIEVQELTKRYGSTTAVDRLSFAVPSGRVTGFLGPNGAGKSTTLRMVLGLDAPTAGVALVGGLRYAALARPLFAVGALLDAGAQHPGRSARDHLRYLARSNGIGRARVDQVLDLAGIERVAAKRVGGFSLGMKQRLGIAAALLGDPEILVFDEPINGLDPDGIHWIRGLLKALAAEGRTVFVSSHVMSEMALTADHLIVIGRGRLLADMATADFVASGSGGDVFVRTPRGAELTRLLESHGGTAAAEPGEGLAVRRVDAGAIARIAADHGIPLHELTPRRPSLEDAYRALTESDSEYRGGGSVRSGKGA